MQREDGTKCICVRGITPENFAQVKDAFQKMGYLIKDAFVPKEPKGQEEPEPARTFDPKPRLMPRKPTDI